MIKVSACFSQMGGLRGLLPLLEDASNYNVSWHGREPALGYLRARGHAAKHPNELILNAERGGVLVTDTINMSRTEEGALCRDAWRAAADAGMPSVAFVDCWWGYRERFLLPGESLAEVRLPDVIAVVDETARADMVALDFPPDRLHVLGSPWLASLAGKRAGAGAARREARTRYGIAPDELVFSFVSQPLARVLNNRDSWGFTERDVVPALVRACETLSAQARTRLRLIFLAHPEEDEAELACLVRELFPSFRAEVRKAQDSLALVQASDAVAGMFSILLVEAALCGLPVLSIQPGLKREDMLVTNRTGATLVVRDVTLLSEVLKRLLYDKAFRDERIRCQDDFPVVTGAAWAWSGLLHDLVSHRRKQ